jgi:hypothetical protein
MGENGHRGRVEPTEDWEQIEHLCGWPEQRDYELIRPLVLFGSSAAGRALETGAASERTLQRRVARFEAEGMESLFGSEHARRRQLPPAVRRLIVDLKAEHPGFNLNEIAGAVYYVRYGRRPDHKTVRWVLEEEPTPLRFVRRSPPYHEIPEPAERRRAVVALHASEGLGPGWSAKAIAGYLRMHRSTVHLSPRTCRRILATNRELYGLDKPKGLVKEKKEMPFRAARRHHNTGPAQGTLPQGPQAGREGLRDLRPGQPLQREPLQRRHPHPRPRLAPLGPLRCGEGVRLARGAGDRRRRDLPGAAQAKAVYGALGIAKHEIERGRPWQSYIETAFNVQRRMADWHFARAEN